MNNELYQDINTLLTFLRGRTGNEAVEFCDAFYKQYNNPAPAILLKEQIDIVQKHLDNHRGKEILREIFDDE